MLLPLGQIPFAPSKFRHADGAWPADLDPPHPPHQRICALSRGRVVETLSELPQIWNAQRLLFLPNAPPQSLVPAPRAFGQPVFPANPLRRAIQQTACSAGVKSSFLPPPSNLLPPSGSCVGARWPRLRNEQPAYREKAQTWPGSNRPCSLCPRASRSGESCTE